MLFLGTRKYSLLGNFFYGTGSYPCPPQGWQRPILLAAKREPLSGPCFLIASIEYCEQVGVYLQVAGNNGEIAYR